MSFEYDNNQDLASLYAQVQSLDETPSSLEATAIRLGLASDKKSASRILLIVSVVSFSLAIFDF
jgi:hypothetical protein